MGICLILIRLPNIFFSIELRLFSFSMHSISLAFLKSYVSFLMNKHSTFFVFKVANKDIRKYSNRSDFAKKDGHISRIDSQMSLIQLHFTRSFLSIVLILFVINLYLLGYRLRSKYPWFGGNITSCNFSLSESEGLFCESDEKWLERKTFYREQREKNLFTMNEYEDYFKQNWFPEFQCQNEIRLGELDGGKWVTFQTFFFYENLPPLGM